MSFWKSLLGRFAPNTYASGPTPTQSESTDVLAEVKLMLRKSRGARDFVTRANLAGFCTVSDDALGRVMKRADSVLGLIVLPSRGPDKIWTLMVTASKESATVTLVNEGESKLTSPPDPELAREKPTGARLLEQFCLQEVHSPSDRWLRSHPLLMDAAAHLRTEGPAGVDSAAMLLRELFNCRSTHARIVIKIVSELQPSTALIGVLEEIISGPDLAPAPSRCRFKPELFGPGQVAWGGTRIRQAAAMCLEGWGIRERGKPGPAATTLPSPESHLGDQKPKAISQGWQERNLGAGKDTYGQKPDQPLDRKAGSPKPNWIDQVIPDELNSDRGNEPPPEGEW